MKNGTLSSIAITVAGCCLAVDPVWAASPFPVPAAGGLVECEVDLALCAGDLDSCDIALDTCTTDLATCDGNLSFCQVYADYLEVQIKQCNSDIDRCLATSQPFPATGQTSCWDSLGTPIECAGTGHDGDIQAGATLAYTDNGDGTITDDNTGLMWIKQDDNNLLHPSHCDSYPGNLDKDCLFNWDNGFTFVASLNANNHAGHSDWRLPNIKELLSIVNYENQEPAISAAFNNGCEPGCTVESCSCTAARELYESSTISLGFDDVIERITISFRFGITVDAAEYWSTSVRAVRGGL